VPGGGRGEATEDGRREAEGDYREEGGGRSGCREAEGTGGGRRRGGLGVGVLMRRLSTVRGRHGLVDFEERMINLELKEVLIAQ
jgi:hypothetical protein